MLELSPQDEAVIHEFIGGIRLALLMDPPGPEDPLWTKLSKTAKIAWLFTVHGKELQRWIKVTAEEFTAKMKDPLIRQALAEMWYPQFSMGFILFTLAYMHTKNAGYPIGGSMPMSRALEKRFLDLGGQIHYDSRVEKILVENDRAVGIRLTDGSEHRAGRVISAADGYATIFKMLDGKYADEKIKEIYEKWEPFPPLLYVGIGVNRAFEKEPITVSGFSYPLRQPLEIGGEMVDRMPVHLFNQDPTLAPAGKTSLVVALPARYEYWKALAEDRAAYDEKKDQVARVVVSALEQRFPGIGGDVEMVDVATPLTFERYTGNWKGSFEGWLITPQNADTVMKPMSQTLPGLSGFYQCEQWVEPGGGLPTGVTSGRRLVQALCKEDGIKFNTRTA
jgi:phytoene dehydrogenase-like protein